MFVRRTLREQIMVEVWVGSAFAPLLHPETISVRCYRCQMYNGTTQRCQPGPSAMPASRDSPDYPVFSVAAAVTLLCSAATSTCRLDVLFNPWVTKLQLQTLWINKYKRNAELSSVGGAYTPRLSMSSIHAIYGFPLSEYPHFAVDQSLEENSRGSSSGKNQK